MPSYRAWLWYNHSSRLRGRGDEARRGETAGYSASRASSRPKRSGDAPVLVHKTNRACAAAGVEERPSLSRTIVAHAANVRRPCWSWCKGAERNEWSMGGSGETKHADGEDRETEKEFGHGGRSV